jgi:glycosyltransferase involved in cell wall biosynthesis
MDQGHPYYQDIKTIIASCPQGLDVADDGHMERVREMAEGFLGMCPGVEDIGILERELIGRKDEIPMSAHLAVKLAKSKRIVSLLKDEIKVSIVFAVYKEHNRIRTRAEHKDGENFLVRKISQLKWLFDDYPNFVWELVIVDDGCPMESGKIAQQIIREHDIGDNVKVLFLEEAIRDGMEVARPMVNTDASQKGGSIAYGLWYAVQHCEQANHIVVYTDADLSTHLGQVGLLLDGIINKGKDVAIGSRREKASVVIKKGVRDSRGKLFIYLWKRMIGQLNYIVDTQCGFKAFKADAIRPIVGNLIEKKFAFDIELLLRAELNRKDAIAKVPIVWIDSEAGSTTTELQPYLSMLKAIAKIYRAYLPPDDIAQEYAGFIESMDGDNWQKLVENIPIEIDKRAPVEFGSYDEVTVSDLKKISD